jgi:histone-lysine N-methyltransferase SETMAR
MAVIPEGAFVACYTGELLSTAAARGRREQYDKSSLNFLLSVRETIPKRGMVLKMYVDATKHGNETRFINHSCDPSLELQLVRVDAMVPHVCFFARRAISCGEELTFDYAAAGMVATADVSPFQEGASDSSGSSAAEGKRRRCLCGADCCRGYLPYDHAFD